MVAYISSRYQVTVQIRISALFFENLICCS
uniref:Uncharacterized protein n=1 Tax=Siphoviridae sp. ct4Uy2 TaxID=2827777 RepID=A0A8S5SJF1_9CAUD|nr:MAG TPA: hypothetical protein [Siphoviridae sp. ct4Uy2]